MESAGMEPVQCHRFCPRCGHDGLSRPRAAVIQCPACHLVLYFNPAVAVAGIIRNHLGRIMFIRRAKDPSKGKLAFPGGFIEIGERAEDALTREVREEVNIPIRDAAFLCSQPNRYFYKEITYPVVDLFFTAVADLPGEIGSPVEVDSVLWLHPATVNPDDLAFPSMRATWTVFMKGAA
jgi:mutator protein MutT